MTDLCSFNYFQIDYIIGSSSEDSTKASAQQFSKIHYDILDSEAAERLCRVLYIGIAYLSSLEPSLQPYVLIFSRFILVLDFFIRISTYWISSLLM